MFDLQIVVLQDVKPSSDPSIDRFWVLPEGKVRVVG
jgi:hypothetical protein